MNEGQPENVHPMSLRGDNANYADDNGGFPVAKRVVAWCHVIFFLGTIFTPAFVSFIYLGSEEVNESYEEDCASYHNLKSFTCPVDIYSIGCCNDHWA